MANSSIRPSGAFIVDYVAIDSTALNSAQASLTASPLLPFKTFVDVVGGAAQAFTIDFTISGNSISWSGLGLQSVLSVGDILRVEYFIA